MNRTPRRPLAGLRPPAAPPEMRRRVLDAARAVPLGSLPDPEGSRTLADRCWESRPLRLAWAAAVVLLLVVNGFIGSARSGEPTARIAARNADRSADRGDRVTLLASRETVLRALLPDDPSEAVRSARRGS